MNRLDAVFAFEESALRLRGQRQELLAANIANSDTPHYKARDFDFAATLKSAVSGVASDGTQLAMTPSSAAPRQGMFELTSNNMTTAAKYRASIQGSVDGNSVDVDVERNQFTDNAIRYEASLTQLHGQIKDMQAVLAP